MAAATNQDFKIGTIGYYKRDNDMNVTVNVRPRHLNGNLTRFQKLQTSEGFVLKDQCINLAEPEVIDDGNIENYFESLLNYISIKGFGEEKPLFVTNKNFMGRLASEPIEGKILIFRYMGVIFISCEKHERTSPEEDQTVFETRKRVSNALAYSHGANYAHYLTRESDDEMISEDYAKSGCKAVMKCDIAIGYKKEIVLYSAEIDALDQYDQHVELKANTRGTEDIDFWKHYICTFYWKMLFGGCSMMIVGDKTGPKKAPGQKTFVDLRIGQVRDHETGKVINERTDAAGNNYPAFSLCKIEVLKIEEIFEHWKEFKKQEPEKRANLGLSNDKPSHEWTVEEGKERVRHFFRQVKRVCRHSDVILAEIGRRKDGFWNFETVNEQHERIREFVKLVKTKMDIWKTNFSN